VDLGGRHVGVGVEDDQRRVQQDHEPQVPEVGVVDLAVVEADRHQTDDVEQQGHPRSEHQQGGSGSIRHGECGDDFEGSEDHCPEECPDADPLGVGSTAGGVRTPPDGEDAGQHERAECEGHKGLLMSIVHTPSEFGHMLFYTLKLIICQYTPAILLVVYW